MSGYMVPLVQCEAFDYCQNEEWAKAETTIADLRRRIRAEGWCKHHDRLHGGTLDYCPLDGCCPWCSSDEARVGRVVGAVCVPFTAVLSVTSEHPVREDQ